MKALTLTQPWAQMVAIGAKHVETRDWAPPGWLRGQLLAIHAAKTFGGLRGTGYPMTANGLREACNADPYYHPLAEHGHLSAAHLALTEKPPIDMTTIPLGAVVAVATVNGWTETEIAKPQLQEASIADPRWALELQLGNYEPERWAWKLANVIPLTRPIPCDGQRLIWDLPHEVNDAVLQAIGQR